jgi:hypothetical protein
MWSTGTISISGIKVSYEVKHFENPSDWGIDCGRISKMAIRIPGMYGDNLIAHYDRGWDVLPETEFAQLACDEVMHRFN